MEENGLSIRLYCDTVARILEERYGMKVTCAARPRAEAGEAPKTAAP